MGMGRGDRRQTKVKRVKVSGTAMASDLDMLPARDTVEAIRTRGRSAIEAYLERGEEPPDTIEFHTGGQAPTS